MAPGGSVESSVLNPNLPLIQPGPFEKNFNSRVGHRRRQVVFERNFPLKNFPGFRGTGFLSVQLDSYVQKGAFYGERAHAAAANVKRALLVFQTDRGPEAFFLPLAPGQNALYNNRAVFSRLEGSNLPKTVLIRRRPR